MTDDPTTSSRNQEHDYLWDRSGTPDREIERLEDTLSPLRYRRGPAPVSSRRRRSRRWLAAAAAVGLVGVAVMWAVRSGDGDTGWPVEAIAGQATIDRRPLTQKRHLKVGQ